MYGLATEICRLKQEAERAVLGLMLFDPPTTRRIAWAHSISQLNFSDYDLRIIFLSLDLAGKAGKDQVGCLRLAMRALRWAKCWGSSGGMQWDEVRLAQLVAVECYRPYADIPLLLGAWCDRLSDLTKRINFARECSDLEFKVLRDGMTHRVSLPTGFPKKPEVKSTRDKRPWQRNSPQSTGKALRAYRSPVSRP